MTAPDEPSPPTPPREAPTPPPGAPDAPPVAPVPRRLGRAGGGRDRDEDGRPEQGRPRDRTGRPLAYALADGDVPLAEDFVPATLGEALDLGVWLWDRERFFECHEALEHVWHAAAPADRDFWQGVIQVAVAGVHHQRGNLAGYVPMLRKAAGRLAAYRPAHRDVDTSALVDLAMTAAAAAERAGALPDASPVPRFPLVGGGQPLGPDERAVPIP